MAEATPADAESRAEAALWRFRNEGEDRRSTLVELLTGLRLAVGDKPEFQLAVDRSRTAWHRHRVAADYRATGEGPRAQVWRDHLERDRIVGEHWGAWPEAVKNRIVDDCVAAEAAATGERLIDWSARTGHSATWNTETGQIEFATAAAAAEFGPQVRQHVRAAAYLTALDAYQDIETRQVTEFTDAKVEQLTSLGYACEFAPRTPSELPGVRVDPAAGRVEFNAGGEAHYPRQTADAQALTELATLADRLPPLTVDPDDGSWRRWDYQAQARGIAPEMTSLAEPEQNRVYAGLADARTAAVNRALTGTGYVWDPQKGLPVPLPGQQPAALNDDQLAAVEYAKASVDVAEVYRRTTAPNPVDLAFPDSAPARHVDTGPAADTTTYISAPAPEL